jgi:hypothetical protein
LRDTTFMLSGIGDLECKMVKNAGQCLWVLFTSAQKTTNLACNLCKNGWEKGHTPFLEVGEDQEIYNFPFYTLVHYSSIFWRQIRSKRVRLNWFWLVALQSATAALRLAGPARWARPQSAGPRTVDPAPCTAPPALPRLHASRVERSVATPRRPCAAQPTASPPYA